MYFVQSVCVSINLKLLVIVTIKISKTILLDMYDYITKTLELLLLLSSQHNIIDVPSQTSL